MVPLQKFDTTRKPNPGENNGIYSPPAFGFEAKRLIEDSCENKTLKTYEIGLSAFDKFPSLQNTSKV